VDQSITPVEVLDTLNAWLGTKSISTFLFKPFGTIPEQEEFPRDLVEDKEVEKEKHPVVVIKVHMQELVVKSIGDLKVVKLSRKLDSPKEVSEQEGLTMMNGFSQSIWTRLHIILKKVISKSLSK